MIKGQEAEAEAIVKSLNAQAYAVAISVCIKKLPVSVVHVLTQQVMPELKQNLA